MERARVIPSEIEESPGLQLFSRDPSTSLRMTAVTQQLILQHSIPPCNMLNPGNTGVCPGYLQQPACSPRRSLVKAGGRFPTKNGRLPRIVSPAPPTRLRRASAWRAGRRLQRRTTAGHMPRFPIGGGRSVRLRVLPAKLVAKATVPEWRAGLGQCRSLLLGLLPIGRCLPRDRDRLFPRYSFLGRM